MDILSAINVVVTAIPFPKAVNDIATIMAAVFANTPPEKRKIPPSPETLRT